MKPISIGRFGTRLMYLGPDNHAAHAMRYTAAVVAFRHVADLKAELDAELAHAKATGLGDHAKINRLVSAIYEAAGRMPWEVSI